jgi:hypothetical protein
MDAPCRVVDADRRLRPQRTNGSNILLDDLAHMREDQDPPIMLAEAARELGFCRAQSLNR